MVHQTLSHPLYHNCLMLAPDGMPMCRLDKKRAEWYLSRNLAEKKADLPLTIQLKFCPNGLGKAGDSYYLAEKNNVCVVCGNPKDLTRHHILPYCFRRYFPAEIKDHCSYDIVPMCHLCHDKYEKHAFGLKKKIAEEYGISMKTKGATINKEILLLKKCACALLRHGDKIPNDKRTKLLLPLLEHFKVKEITLEQLTKTMKLNALIKPKISWGELIVREIPDLQDFVYRWRIHFLKHMKPKFMSPYWNAEKSITEG